MQGIQYIIDDQGEKKAVVIDLAQCWLFPLSFYLSEHLIFSYLKALFFRRLLSLNPAYWKRRRVWNPYSAVIFRLNGKSQVSRWILVVIR